MSTCRFPLTVGVAFALHVTPFGFAQDSSAGSSSDVRSRTFPTDGEAALVSEFLGWGYDAIAGRFADTDALKNPVFEVDSFAKPGLNLPGDYVFSRVTKADQREKSGASTQSYADDLSAGLEMGVDTGMFSGEIRANTSSSERGGTDSSYASITDTRVVFTARLDQAKVNPGVLADMEALPAREIIKKYGTHYTTGVEFGGYIRFTHSEQATTDNKTFSVMASLKASYEGVNVGADGSTSNENSSLVRKGSTKLHFQGGTQVGLTAENFFKDGTRDMIDGQLAKWAASLASNPGFAGFLPGGLQPLWTLPGLSAGKATALKDEVAAYAKEQGAGLFDRKGPAAKERIAQNGTFCLWHHNNAWLSDYDGNGAQYWVKLGGPVKYQFFECGSGNLNSGDYVQIVSTQGMPGGYGGYNILSIFTKEYAYLYSKDGSGNYYPGQKWRIWKDSRGTEGPIYYGDKVVIESLYYSGSVYYLVRNGDYANTGPNPETWIITKEGEEPQ